jgi:hypothetical protein
LQLVKDAGFSLEFFMAEIAGQAYGQSVEYSLSTGFDKPSGTQLASVNAAGFLGSVATGATAAAAGAIATTDIDTLYGALPYGPQLCLCERRTPR